MRASPPEDRFTIETSTIPRLQLVEVARTLEGVGPEGFLRAAAGDARGFWARGARWLAHRGVLATVEALPEDGADRFARVRDDARALAESMAAPGAGGGPAPRLRFYGGFSFREAPERDPFWAQFPPGLFILPRIELQGDGGGSARLRVRGRAGPGEDADALTARLERELEALAAELVRGRDAQAGAQTGRDAGNGAAARSAVPTAANPTSPAASALPPAASNGRAPAARASADQARDAWQATVAKALAEVERGRFTKVVLARTLEVPTGRAAGDPVPVVLRLWAEYRATHVFLFEPAPGHALVGAAPETVATLRRGVFHATAVAGSVRGGDSEEERRALAAGLLASAKDRAEQRIVVEDMVRRLEPLVGGVRAEEGAHVLSLARIQHLETEIRARVAGAHVLDLLAALHPTPAVCGVPRDEALDFLDEEEPFERGWYAGPVGFFEPNGDGVFAPALRSAVLSGGTWRLFAGAGIVAGSHPELEWEESGLKFEPVLRALEASGVRAG